MMMTMMMMVSLSTAGSASVLRALTSSKSLKLCWSVITIHAKSENAEQRLEFVGLRGIKLQKQTTE